MGNPTPKHIETGLVSSAAWMGLHLGLFFVLLELIKLCRSALWNGLSAQDIGGLLLALALYALGATVLMAFAGAVLRRLAGNRCPWYTMGPLVALFAGGCLWGILSRYREYAPTPDDVLVLGGLLAYATVAMLVLRRARTSMPFFGVWGALSMTAACFAALAPGYYFLLPLDPEPLKKALFVMPPLWALFVAVTGWRLWISPRRPRYVLRVLHCTLPAWILGLELFHCLPITAPASTQPPNLVFIVADALRADTPSFNGGPVPTPNLDALAREGAIFEKAYSLAPWTSPSMSALFDSSYPPGLTPGAPYAQWRDELWRYAADPEQNQLPKELRARGYDSAALVANTLVWTLPNLLDDFTVCAQSQPVMLVRAGCFRTAPFLWDALHALWPAAAPKRPQDCTEALNRQAQEFLRRHPKGPLFLFVHYIDPHAPCDPPERFRTQNGPWPFYYPYDGGEQWGIPVLGPNFKIAEQDRAYVRSLYDGEVRYVDEAVGQLRAWFKARGMDQNTYYCFLADHGEELWDHGKWGHGQSVAEELIRVPWMLSGPGIKPRRIAEPVSCIDVMPTLAALMKTPAGSQWKGLSWAEWLRGEMADPPPQRPIFVQATNDTGWPEPRQAVIDQGYKLVRELGSNVTHLYHLDQDPKEAADVGATDPERAEALTRQLDEWQASFPALFPAQGADAGSAEERRQALEGMGYIR